MDTQKLCIHYINYNLKGSVMRREQFQWVLLVFWWGIVYLGLGSET